MKMVEYTGFIYAKTRIEAIKKIKKKYGRNPHNIEWGRDFSNVKNKRLYGYAVRSNVKNKRLYTYAVWL